MKSGTLAFIPHRIGQMLRKSGPAPDCALFLRLMLKDGKLKTFLLRFLRLRVSPDALLRIRRMPLPLEERARLFCQAISLINVNETYKTTGRDRTRLADKAILKLAACKDAVRLLDIGVSDGSASLTLLSDLPNLREAVLTDLHPLLYAWGPRLFRVFLDGQQRLLGIKLLGLYIILSFTTPRSAQGFETISTLNPLLSERLGIAAIRPFNALCDRLSKPVDIIKCANVLNRAYFSEADLRTAVANLALSLVEAGHLVISQNNARYTGGEAYFILKRQGPDMVLEEEQGGHEVLRLFQGDGEGRT
ncbi:MAG: hypothetical protein KKF77_15225 [Proteobacteria bacterium]|nr:hypothetical protein [Pseudomonadota bacterium]